MLIFKEQQQNTNILVHVVIVEAFNNVLAEQLFKHADAQKLQDLEKVSAIRVKNLGSIINKTNTTK